MFSNLNGALEDLNEAVRLDQTNAIAYYRRGLLRTANDCDGAIKDFEESIRLDPKNARHYSSGLADAYDSLGCTRADRDGDNKGAIDAFNRAINIYPENGRFFYDRATVRFDLGDYRGAIADANDAIRRVPNYATAYLIRGRALYSLRSLKPAIDSFDQTITLRIGSEYAQPYQYRGRARLEFGDKTGAIEDFRQVIRLDPKDSRTRQKLASLER